MHKSALLEFEVRGNHDFQRQKYHRYKVVPAGFFLTWNMEILSSNFEWNGPILAECILLVLP